MVNELNTLELITERIGTKGVESLPLYKGWIFPLLCYVVCILPFGNDNRIRFLSDETVKTYTATIWGNVKGLLLFLFTKPLLFCPQTPFSLRFSVFTPHSFLFQLVL